MFPEAPEQKEMKNLPVVSPQDIPGDTYYGSTSGSLITAAENDTLFPVNRYLLRHSKDQAGQQQKDEA